MSCAFLDADDYHPKANVDKMSAGIPLTDEDRWPWLDRLVSELRRYDDQARSAVLACSALKQSYRARLARASVAADGVRFVYLKGDRATIEARMNARKGHYMSPTLVASQFAALEEPIDAIVVDIRGPTEAQVQFIMDRLGAHA